MSVTSISKISFNDNDNDNITVSTHTSPPCYITFIRAFFEKKIHACHLCQFPPTRSPMGVFFSHPPQWEPSWETITVLCGRNVITVATKKMTRSHATSFNIVLVLITITKDDDHDNVSEDIGDDHDVDDHEGVDPTTAIKDTA